MIGRLLHDTQQILEDQLVAVTSDSRKWGTTGDAVDLALLVDGLQAEREQGITIDVAYRYFDTEARKYIIADCPGHEQYTRNMATGASTADLAVILVEPRAACRCRRGGTRISSRCSGFGTSLSRSTRWTSSYDEKVFRGSTTTACSRGSHGRCVLRWPLCW
jgi:sulfate adenylyltransferase subunit 1 (EFTu-like GTPase family)